MAPEMGLGKTDHKISIYYTGDRLAPRTEVQPSSVISTRSPESIVGRYDYGGPVLRVTVRDGHAYVQLSGEPRYEIFPESDTHIFLEGGGCPSHVCER